MATCATVHRRGFPWLGVVLVLGLGLRLYHYLREPSVWHDEAALIVNVLIKDFRELLGPLKFAEAAPPLFLWVERAVSLVLGDGTYALRLLPFLGSCAALVLFAWAARRLLPATAVPWAVLLLACSDRILWHGSEAKPYALDILAAVTLIALYVGLREWPAPRQFLLFALLAPIVIFLTYPGCFLYGGLLVALLPALWRDRRPMAWLSYAVLVGAVFVSFGLLVIGPVRAQHHEMMTMCWLGQFPDWQRPWSVPPWMLFSTLDVVRYCFEPTGHALGIIAGVGAILLWRRGDRELVALLALPLLLALGASCFSAYPFGGARVEVFAAPGLALLVGVAVLPLAAWLRERSRWGVVGLALLLLAPLGPALYRAVDPWPRADCAGAAEYVRVHRRPEDGIVGNHWEYFYYFRQVGRAFQPIEAYTLDGIDRLWLVLTGGTPDEERDIVEHLPGSWQTLQEERTFDKTTIYLLRRVSLSAVPSALPHSRP
jgi:hypothetical protein